MVRSDRDAARRCARRLFRITHLAFVSCVLAASACGGSFTDPDPANWSVTRTFLSDSLAVAGGHVDFGAPHADAGPPITRDGLRYTAGVAPIDTTAGSKPMDLSIEVRVSNPTSSAVSVPVKGCTVWPEFRTSQGSAEPVWVPEQCAQDDYVVTIEPGDDHVFSFLAHDVMLSHALEDGRYYVTARFRHADETLRLSAGSADVRLRIPNLAFHVQVHQDAGQLAARVRLVNLNTHAVALEWGHCAVGFELYRNADLTGPPQHIEAERTCLRYLATGVLQPGVEMSPDEFSYSADIDAGRHPALESGEYHVVVTFRLNWRTYRFPMGALTLR